VGQALAVADPPAADSAEGAAAGSKDSGPANREIGVPGRGRLVSYWRLESSSIRNAIFRALSLR
jgi:hypothetical protein